MATWFTGTAGAIEIDVLVVPKASRSRIVGVHGDRLKVQVAAPPEDGAANRATIDVLAMALGVKRSHIELASGKSSRRKRIRITGVTEAMIRGLEKP